MNLRAAVVVGTCLTALVLVACDQKETPLSSAGGLPESRLPSGVWAETPAVTAAKSADQKFEAAWHKNASPVDKAPEHNDTVSGVKLPFPQMIPHLFVVLVIAFAPKAFGDQGDELNSEIVFAHLRKRRGR